jgi:hypothetical protein
MVKITNFYYIYFLYCCNFLFKFINFLITFAEAVVAADLNFYSDLTVVAAYSPFF